MKSIQAEVHHPDPDNHCLLGRVWKGHGRATMFTWNLSIRTLVFGLLVFFTAHPAAGQKMLAPSPINSASADSVDKAPPATADESNPTLHKRNWRYRINPSDTLDLSFELTPEFNQTVTVQPDGYITLRDAGDLYAEGKTLPGTYRGHQGGLLQDSSRSCNFRRSPGFREALLHCGRTGRKTRKV